MPVHVHQAMRGGTVPWTQMTVNPILALMEALARLALVQECEVNVDERAADPCGNGGTCKAEVLQCSRRAHIV